MKTIVDKAPHLQNLNPSQNIFYRARIEDNNDGGEHGACKVRIMGIHSEDHTKVPSNTLPWAELSVPTSMHGGVSGIGHSAVPQVGSWVWVFLDGGNWNTPVITSIISATQTEDESFGDPSKTEKKGDRNEEPDQNRLSAGRKLGETPIMTVRDANKETAVPYAAGGTWKENDQKTSSASYPNNTVIETVGGSLIEYDSTPGNERIHFFHNSGSYWEIQNSGDYIQKTVNNYINIVDVNSYSLVNANKFTTVEGSEQVLVVGKKDINIGGSYDLDAKGKIYLNCNR